MPRGMQNVFGNACAGCPRLVSIPAYGLRPHLPKNGESIGVSGTLDAPGGASSGLVGRAQDSGSGGCWLRSHEASFSVCSSSPRSVRRNSC